MTEVWGILTNWIALGASLTTVYFVFKIISIPLWESEISFFGHKLGFLGALFIKIPIVAFIQGVFSFLTPVILVFFMQLSLIGWGNAMKMPVGVLISEAGKETQIWIDDIWFSLSGQEEKIKNQEFKLWDSLKKDEEKSSTLIPDPTQVNPVMPPSEPTSVTITQEISTPIPASTLVPPPLPTQVDYIEAWKKLQMMACLEDGIWGLSNLPPGEYYVENSTWSNLEIKGISGLWKNMKFCLSKKASKSLSNDGKELKKGGVFEIR